MLKFSLKFLCLIECLNFLVALRLRVGHSLRPYYNANFQMENLTYQINHTQKTTPQ